MKNKLKLAFADMWGGVENNHKGSFDYSFNPYDNYFIDLLSQKFEIEITSKNPDLLVYSVFGTSFTQYNCKKILFCGENKNYAKSEKPHFAAADVTLSHYEEEAKEIYLPLWVVHTNWFNKTQPRPLPSNPAYSITLEKIYTNRDRFLRKERNFCSFVNNNPIEDRIQLFQNLTSRLQVDSFGHLHNNQGLPLRGSQEDKVKLLEKYVFNIAFENSYHPGYNTEKITEPLEAGCIPLYNGGEKVREYFDTSCFLYYKDFESMEKYVEKIFDVFYEKDVYKAMISKNPLKLDNIQKDFDPVIVLEKILEKINL